MRKSMYFLTSVMAIMMLIGFSIEIAQARPCELPVFDANNFDTNSQSPTCSANITNPYLPLVPGTVFKYEPVPNDENVVDIMTVTGTIKTITLDGDSIDCLQVHDFETVDGVLSEDTLDWYTQDFEGNVWYCGEDTTEYLEGGGIDKTGSWEAGQDVSGLGVDALPGYVMLASQKSGECYQQESYPSEAEDKAKIMRLNVKVELDNGDSYVDCL